MKTYTDIRYWLKRKSCILVRQEKIVNQIEQGKQPSTKEITRVMNDKETCDKMIVVLEDIAQAKQVKKSFEDKMLECLGEPVIYNFPKHRNARPRS